MSPPFLIRPATAGDWPDIWPIVDAVLAEGHTYAWEDLDAESARLVWLDGGAEVLVAFDGSALVGTYQLKPNQPGRGSHVCNASFMVAPDARGRGVGRCLAEDALRRARAAGYAGMQFNLVVATNSRAVALWRRLGFEELGRISGGFRHARLGRVDALIMYRSLEDDT